MKRLLLVATVFSATVFAKPVNINNADAQTLSDSLTGINLKKAQAIVANREKYGAFKTVEDLRRVVNIGEKTIAINKGNILLADSQMLAANSPVLQNPSPNLTGTSAELNFEQDARKNTLTTLFLIAGAVLCFAVLAVAIKYQRQRKSKTNDVPSDF